MLCVCFVSVVMHKDKEDAQQTLHRPRADLTAFDHTPLDGEMFLQALNGFLMILTCEGEVFFATHSIEGYLGFHQVSNFYNKALIKFKKFIREKEHYTKYPKCILNCS